MVDEALIERLKAHRRVGSVPREQLEWLATHGTLMHYGIGDIVGHRDQPIPGLFVLLAGRLAIRVDRGAGPRKVMEWEAGDVAGQLPFSRLVTPPGDTKVEEPIEALLVSREHFPEMIARCHELTAVMVHVMLDRARRFTTSDLQNEKMISLGRLSAGLAHELNNPASALARTARELKARVFELEASALALGAMRLTPEQLAMIAEVRNRCIEPEARARLSPLERADREDAVAGWLARRRLGVPPEELAETCIDVAMLDQLAAGLAPDQLEFAIRSIGASHRARMLATDVEIAAGRVHSLVAAVKGFTHMDQTDVPKPVAIGQGLHDTMAVLGSKAREKSVAVRIEVADDLPQVDGFGGELNQVWANLIDNAIDAAPSPGHVEVCADARDDSVVVRVIDDGPGIPADRLARIFDPFFTTKPVGQGTGLGLDIARRLVRQHDGDIEVDSRPGRTEFRVILPRTR